MERRHLLHLAEVVLNTGPRASALVDLFADPRVTPCWSRLQLVLGAACPHCDQGVVVVVVGDWTRDGLEPALLAAGHCRHERPTLPAEESGAGLKRSAPTAPAAPAEQGGSDPR